jgi:hypothetical protein
LIPRARELPFLSFEKHQFVESSEVEAHRPNALELRQVESEPQQPAGTFRFTVKSVVAVSQTVQL